MINRSILKIVLFVFVLTIWSSRGISQPNMGEEIYLPVAVFSQDGNIVANLPQSRFSIEVDKSPLRLSSFSNQSSPASILILVDCSGSVRSKLDDNLELIKSNLVAFMQSSHPASEYAVYTFHRSAKLEIDWNQNSPETGNKINQVEFSKFVGVTNLYDSCIDAMQSLKNRKNQKRIVLIITDGVDTDSKYKDSDLKKLSYELLSPIFFINVGGVRINRARDVAGGTLDMLAENTTSEIALLTGGLAVLPRTREGVADSFKRVAAFVKYQYLIGINTASIPKDNKQHKLQVKIIQPPDAPKEMRNLKVIYPQFWVSKK